ncbi:glycosyltransferase family 2 protein [Megamonas rupellensis]|uniref:glycosyltransferase family 2 protein n=1 Tax=Megamonas rupellensis TaxID=491921 RepID=UPI000370CC98|nr:glycosyltransferase family 2 protein [Megamonas rupellensis]
MKPLVSIITPCYNGNGKIQLYLNSILKQTYDNIEIILINDGSTDNTEEIILSYKSRFIDKGYKFIYLKQKNSGQDVALNNGLKYFSGDYLMWPDSDDILLPTNIEEKVKYLEENKSVGLVYCNTNLVREDNLDNVVKKWNKVLSKDRLENVNDILLNKVVLAGGAWMMRSSFFLKQNPSKQIIVTGQGQNLQMLLPIAFNYDMGKVDKYLFTYVIYKNSHSNKKRTYEEMMKRIDDSIKGIDNILKTINLEKSLYDRYFQMVKNEWEIIRLDTAIGYFKWKDSRIIYRNLKINNVNVSFKLNIKYYLNQCGLYKYIKKWII